MIEEQQPLTGYRVLDLSGPMGVYCGKLMAGMGADVIKAEPPGGTPCAGMGHSPMARLTRNKASTGSTSTPINAASP